MNKSELVDAVAENTGVAKTDVDATIRGLAEVVADVVSKGDEKITIPGFVSFERTLRSARQGRNPATNEAIDIPASYAVKVSAGAKLKDAAKTKTP